MEKDDGPVISESNLLGGMADEIPPDEQIAEFTCLGAKCYEVNLL